MATGYQDQPQTTHQQAEPTIDRDEALLRVAIRQTMEYTPLGSDRAVKLNPAIVKRYLTSPTRSGKMPTEADIMKFMMLCRARGLDPWVGDAYLVGFDSKDGPQFSLITSIQALLKRAESNPEFDGMESGIIVQTPDGKLEERAGELLLAKEHLVGAWARVHRGDRKVPTYKSVNLAPYNTGRSIWQKDPAGMICKVARAGAIREAFPGQLGQMYTSDEMGEHSETANQPASVPEPVAPTSLDDLAEQVGQLVERNSEPMPEPSSEPEPEPEPSSEGDGLSLEDFTEAAVAGFAKCKNLTEVGERAVEFSEWWTEDDWPLRVEKMAEAARERIRSSRGSRTNSKEAKA